MSLIAGILTAIAWVLAFLTEWNFIIGIACIAGVVIGVIDLITLHKKEKLLFGDFVKEAFRTNLGSMFAVITGPFVLLV